MQRSARIAVLRFAMSVVILPSFLYGQNGRKNEPPTVAMTAPTNGASFYAPANITIAATASDADGTVKKVEFLANGSLIGSDTTAPFSFAWANVAAGNYTLTARATDDRNSKTTSSPVSVSVKAPDPKSVSGVWSSLINFPNPAGCSGCAFDPIHMHLLPNGKILMWQDDNESGYRGSKPETIAYTWDVTTNTFTSVRNMTTDLFCSGHTFLSDGVLLAAGGHNASDNNGTTTTNLFDYRTNTWTLSSYSMNQGRWYPTVTTLASGDALVVSGNMTSATGVNPIPEVWQTSLGGGWRQLTSAPLSQPLYPWMHVAPNGKVFNSGPDQTSRYLDTSGTGAWSFVANHVYPGYRDYGSPVMYDDGKLLVVGGGDPPTNSAETIDLKAASPSWQSAGSMSHARRQMGAIALPDGNVFVTGGSSSGGFNDGTLAVLAAEMWNSTTRAWSVMASMQVARMYHSNLLLLPDGRVVSAGGGRPAATNVPDQPNAQIYSPPYLFKADGTLAARPAISSVATDLAYGQQVAISTPNAASITSVTLVRLGSFTHSFDENQRLLKLPFAASADMVTATMPASSNSCPPGHYILFILADRVPSVGRIVRIH